MKNRLLKTFTSLVLTVLMVISVMPAFAITIGAAGVNTYELVKDASTLAVGDQVIFVAAESAVAMSTTQNDNNRGQAAVKKNNDGTLTIVGDVQVFTLEAGTTTGTFAFYIENEGYLYAASSSKNYLRTQKTLDANGSWTISITNSVATIKAQGSYTRNWLQYNKNSSIFSSYGGAQQDVSIYKLVENAEETTTEGGSGTDTPETPACLHTNTEAIGKAKAATCTEEGTTAGLKCSDCGAIIEEQTVIPATGHTYSNGECTVCHEKQPTTLTINRDSFGSASGYAWHEWSATATTGETINGSGYIYGTTKDSMQMNAKTNANGNYIYNSVELPGSIVSVKLTALSGKTDRGFAVWTSDEPFDSKTNNRLEDENTKLVTKYGVTWEFTTTNRYFAIILGDTKGAAYLSSIEITYSDCNHTNTVSIAKDPATCTIPGKEAGVKCTDCGLIISGCETIPATGHTWGYDNVCDVCGGVPHTIPEVLASNDGTAVVVCGTVKKINTTWSDTHKNISVTIVDADGNELYIYRLATKVEIGDIIRVTGTKTTYNGTKEIAEGATAEIYGKTPVFSGVSLTLNKGVTVNVTLIIPDDWFYVGTAKVVFSNGKSINAIAGENVYSVDLTPAQINDALTVMITREDGETVLVGEKDVSVSTYKAKVESAGAEKLGLSTDKYNTLKSLLDAALVYSDAAGGKGDNLTNEFAGVKDPFVVHGKEDESGNTAENDKLFTGFAGKLGTYASIFINVNTANVQEGDTLVLKVGTGENEKVIINGENIKSYITKDGQIVITGLFPANFDDIIFIESKTEGSAAEFTFNSYLKAIYENSSNQSVKNLAVATYLYGLAAEAYLTAQQ